MVPQTCSRQRVVSPHFIYNFLLYSMNHKLVSGIEPEMHALKPTPQHFDIDNLPFVNGKIILKWIFQNQGTKVENGVN
jgi:hypothetical protein